MKYFVLGVITSGILIALWFASIPTRAQRLCQAYYQHPCTREGELPEGVVIVPDSYRCMRLFHMLDCIKGGGK